MVDWISRRVLLHLLFKGVDSPDVCIYVTKTYTEKPRKKRTDRTKTTKCAPNKRLPNLNMWLTNIRGLRSNKGQLEARIRNAPSNSKPDIILIVESKLDSKVSDDNHLISLNGYSFMRRDRSDNSGWGGCLVYYRNGLPIVREVHLEPKTHELMIFTIQTSSGILLLSLAYCPPKKAIRTIEWYDKHLDSLISKTKANVCILTGDFNCHHKEWLASRSPTDAEGKAAYDMCCAHDLTQIVSGPTHQLGNRLELIITDAPNMFSPDYIDHSIGSSDHFLVQAVLNASPLSETPPPRHVWLYNKADWDGLRNELAATPWDTYLTKGDPEEACSKVTNKILDAMHQFIPQKTASSFVDHPPWWNELCDKALKKKGKTWRRWKALQTPESRLEYNKARNEYTSVSRKACTAHKSRVKDKMTKELHTGSKSWWWTARRLMGKGGKSEIPVLKSAGQTFISADEKAECFASFFSDKSTIPEADNSKAIPQHTKRTNSKCSKVVFWPQKVRKQLEKLNVNKASGPDGIPALVLRTAAAELATPLAQLFQLCFNKGYMPAQWKVADVIPCFKKGDKHSPSNYRPISLLSVLSKVMERLINKAMWKHLDHHKLISDKQFGFRAGHSTSDALTYIAQRLTNTINDREEARVVCLDISKAFDRVWHPGLLVKLQALGFVGKLLDWLSDYLSNRSLKVVLNGKSSSPKSINAGVPQGSILGPLLFIIFIDDITQGLSNPSILYADDVTLMAFIKSKEERCAVADSLNQDLSSIESWATSWNVLFGAAKCKTVTISNRRDAQDCACHPSLQFFGITLTEAENVELLGLTLCKDLSWQHDVTKMAKTAAQRIGLLRRAAPYLVPTQRAIVYKAMVRSKMEYASSAWFGATPTSLSRLDAVQRRAIRIIDLPEKDLISHQIQPLGTRRAVGAITLFHRMFYNEAPELLCQLLPEHLQLDPRLRRSVRSHDLAVVVPRSNLVSHSRSFVPTSARIWNSLPESIPALEKRAHFKKEVNSYLGANRSALS